MADAAFVTEEQKDTWRLVVSGSWTLEAGLAEIDDELRRFADRVMGQHLEIDISQLEGLDTAGAMALQRTMRACEKREAMARDPMFGFSGLDGKYGQLLESASQHLLSCEVEEAQGNAFMAMLDRIGRGAKDILDDIMEIVSFLGQVIAVMFRMLRNPRRLRVTPMFYHMEEAGLNATLIVGLMSFLIGAVIAFMGIKILRQFGAEILTVEMIGITVLREFGVLLTAILIAGRSGSAFTAALGSMKLREEIDAMKAMGIDPIEALVVPRTLAMVFMLPVLAFIAAMMGLIGGGLVAWWAADISPNLFMSRTQDVIVLQNYWVGLVKAPFFAFFISVIGCYQGMSVHGSSEDLGRRTTMSVVQSLFIVILLDAIFAIFFLEMGI